LAAAALLAVAIVLIGAPLTCANNRIDILNAGANTAAFGICPALTPGFNRVGTRVPSPHGLCHAGARHVHYSHTIFRQGLVNGPTRA